MTEERKADDPELLAERAREAELEDVRAILRTDAGRRFIWRIFGETKVFESIWDPSVKIHRNAGAQNVGQWILGEVMLADFEAWLEMSRNVRRELMQAEIDERKNSKGGR